MEMVHLSFVQIDPSLLGQAHDCLFCAKHLNYIHRHWESDSC
jgi:hypothetical protein